MKFSESAEVVGTTRADFLREVIGWINADPELWATTRKVADDRGKTLRGAVLDSLRKYVGRGTT